MTKLNKYISNLIIKNLVDKFYYNGYEKQDHETDIIYGEITIEYKVDYYNDKIDSLDGCWSYGGGDLIQLTDEQINYIKENEK